MRQEKLVPSVLTRRSVDSQRISIDHGPTEAQRRGVEVVEDGQAWYEKHQWVVYDPIHRRRFSIEMWIPIPEDVSG